MAEATGYIVLIIVALMGVAILFEDFFDNWF